MGDEVRKEVEARPCRTLQAILYFSFILIVMETSYLIGERTFVENDQICILKKINMAEV